MEFQSSDEEAAYRERFRRQAQNADPVSKIQFEAWYAAAWGDARGYFDRPTDESRQYVPRGPVDQAPKEIAEAFRAWEKYVEKDGVIPTRLSIFEAGRAAGMGSLEQFRREFPAEETTPAPGEDWTFEIPPDADVAEVIGLALGAASACWENLSGAGIFDSARAKEIHNKVLRYVEGEYGAFRARTAIEADRQTIRPAEVEVTESGLSEFGRGFEAGEQVANARALRIAALGHAVDLAKLGNIQLQNGNGATISFGDPLAVAKSFYEFLAGA